jgi:AraC family transcriptional regulator of adaptative response/methylated-DNA-[protein]-cysteine methyltransferase
MLAPMEQSSSGFVGQRDFECIARAIGFIAQRWAEQPRIESIAAMAGLEPAAFSRLFRRWAGLSPKQYLEFVTARAAGPLLHAAPIVLGAAQALGLSGAGRLHDLMVTVAALTPGEWRARGAGLELCWGLGDSPFGECALAETARGIAYLGFVDPPEPAVEQVQRELLGRWPAARLRRDDARAQSQLQRVFLPRRDGALQVAVAGSNFQIQVWNALLALGRHEHTSYGALAAGLGRRGAARAVGTAVGRNPVSWLIPCHHVLRADGALGGYYWGVERKRAMLEWEALRS